MADTTRLLLCEQPLIVLPSLAKTIGVEEAIVLQQIHYWITKGCGRVYDGVRWIYNRLDDWLEQFQWMTEYRLRKVLGHLRDKGLVKFEQKELKELKRRGWYTIDYDKVEALLGSAITASENIENNHLQELDVEAEVRRGKLPPPHLLVVTHRDDDIREVRGDVSSHLDTFREHASNTETTLHKLPTDIPLTPQREEHEIVKIKETSAYDPPVNLTIEEGGSVDAGSAGEASPADTAWEASPADTPPENATSQALEEVSSESIAEVNEALSCEESQKTLAKMLEPLVKKLLGQEEKSSNFLDELSRLDKGNFNKIKPRSKKNGFGK